MRAHDAAVGEVSAGEASAGRGFALLATLVVLTALYLGTTGIFLAARAELLIATAHEAAGHAFQVAEAGLASWFAAPVQASPSRFAIGDDTATVRVLPLLRVDSVTVLYDVRSRAAVGGSPGTVPAARETGRLGRSSGSGSIVPVPGSWREIP